MAPVDPKKQHVLSTSSTPEKDEQAEISAIHSKVKTRIHLNDLSHKSIPSFVTLIDLATVLPNAIRNVHKHLYKAHGKPPAVRSITLVLESMGGVAYTTGIPLDSMHKEIHLSLDYLANNIKNPVRFRDECIGVIVHEMVHCWQHDCHGSAPGGLIEGIADYVRLKSGLAPPHWKKTKEEAGQKWDEGYQRTAWFLEWLEMEHGDGTVSRMNDAMEGKRYNEKDFWQKLFSTDVGSLWEKYLKHWDEDETAVPDGKPASVASTEPELVDFTEEDKAAAANHEKLQGQV